MERLIGGVARGVGGLLGLAADLERQGKSEYAEEGEISGKTKSGKEYKGAYGFRIKVGLRPSKSASADEVGLNPKDFRDQKKLSQGKCKG